MVNFIKFLLYGMAYKMAKEENDIGMLMGIMLHFSIWIMLIMPPLYIANTVFGVKHVENGIISSLYYKRVNNGETSSNKFMADVKVNGIVYQCGSSRSGLRKFSSGDIVELHTITGYITKNKFCSYIKKP